MELHDYSTISDGQWKFIIWVYKNHLNDLDIDERKIVSNAANESEASRKNGYSPNSLYADMLNSVRDKYLREYGYLKNNKSVY